MGRGIQGSKMNRYQWNAKIAGALIIVGYAAYGIPDGAILQPLLNNSDPLSNVSAQTMQLTTAVLIMAINAFAVVGIALFLYPILKQHNESIALSYIATRTFESIVMIGGLISLLLLVPLSQEYVQSSAADTTSFEALSTLAIQGNFLAYHIAMIGLAIGSLPFCYLLYQVKLVPRLIPVLGLIGYPALLILMLVEIYAFSVRPDLYILYLPGGLFEIGLALWFIIKGFDASAVVSENHSPIVPEATE